MPRKADDSKLSKAIVPPAKKRKNAVSTAPSNAKPIKRSKTYLNLPLIISEELRESILNGDIPLGGHLKQEEIAKQFDSSLIPVREALRTLETEGLITFIPNRGATVSLLDPDRVRQRFETRIFLELGAQRLSVPNLTEEDIALAEIELKAMDQYESARSLSVHNHEFHQILNSRCNNDYLIEQINMLHRSVDRYLRHYMSNEDYYRLTQEHHHRIFNEVKAGNAEGASKWLELHLNEALKNLEAICAK